jgi:hypothetical protein
MLKLYTCAALAGLFLAVMAPAALADKRIYFFGNEYTSFNGGMDKMVQALLEEALKETVETQANLWNNARLEEHLQDLNGTNPNALPRQALITGNNTKWDLVVVQDQSTLPAYTYSTLWNASRDAGVKINKLVEPTGAVTMFLLTWGRQRGLDSDKFFPNYAKMQDYLNFGIFEYWQAARSPRSFVAPTGIAFRLIYDAEIAVGGSADSKSFRELYDDYEGSHPSEQGSYLSACVIFCAYTGLRVSELTWAPSSIPAERRDYLQKIAEQAVFDDDAFWPQPWNVPRSSGGPVHQLKFADSAPEMESAELKAELMDDLKSELKSDFKSESPEL